MSRALLESIEWHDLPLATLSVTERGIELVVLHWTEATQAYFRYALRITEAEMLKFEITGTLTAKAFGNIEISKFDYTIGSNYRMNGTIGILPDGAGYWTISFINANWSLETA